MPPGVGSALTDGACGMKPGSPQSTAKTERLDFRRYAQDLMFPSQRDHSIPISIRFSATRSQLIVSGASITSLELRLQRSALSRPSHIIIAQPILARQRTLWPAHHRDQEIAQPTSPTSSASGFFLFRPPRSPLSRDSSSELLGTAARCNGSE